ncbi:MAG TPA: DUF4440 domain-containing protein [Vicinamibacterales bacterium]|jgi:ketosteroid isomerase-like protein|nr:DUF4440 domain-containing protein [Vicinamibacterales bacterium]
MVSIALIVWLVVQSNPAARPANADAAQRQRFEELRVRVFGTAAIATGIVAATATDGKTRKTAFTDVFAHRDGRWSAVNAQETPLPRP